jgi:NAD(P)-dependent dehydrogenase (short-subunit alcohol dehydrogenase family)
MRFMPDPPKPDDECHDILTAAGAARAAKAIADAGPVAGMIITLPEGGPGTLAGMADVPRLLTGLLPLLKAFLQSPTAKLVMLVHARESVDTPSRLLAEGLLGLFLSAAQEHPTVQFRTLEIDRDTDLRLALRAALDRACTVVELVCREGSFFTSQGHVTPSLFPHLAPLTLSPGDVVVMSGGATGISAHLARSLAPFSPRLVFLGRTALGDSGDLTPPPGEPPASVSRRDESRAREIARTLADLRSAGIEATYHACDVADPTAVRAVLGEVVGRYGRIDGIIHGAGVLRDGWLEQMSPEDFAQVVDVKFLGAWNLFAAAERAGLRFFAGLSSVAAIQGNPGQANYTAANRMMSALLRHLGRRNSAIRCKALMLPPVEGAGMAEAPEVRALLARRGVAYIHTRELAGLFCRELFVAPAEDDWVMFMRALPAVRTARLNDAVPPSLTGGRDGGTVAFSPEAFPMTDAIARLDLRRELLETARSFSWQNDLWIADHRPLTSLAHPLVSAVMMLEAFLEAARLLYPHLHVRGVRQVRFRDMIPCPPEIPRSSRTTCRRTDANLREAVCEASLAVQDISPAGGGLDRYTPCCTGQVLLDGGGGDIGEAVRDFPVRPDELRGGSLNQKKLLTWYKTHTGLDGRYRVLEAIDGTGPGMVRGRSTYREAGDFAHLPNARYQYSPYLLEALMQLVGFYMVTADTSAPAPVLPVEIGEMRFLRPCRPGERITLEARLRTRDKASVAWDARGLDEQGRAIMQVRALRMQWVAE